MGFSAVVHCSVLSHGSRNQVSGRVVSGIAYGPIGAISARQFCSDRDISTEGSGSTVPTSRCANRRQPTSLTLRVHCIVADTTCRGSVRCRQHVARFGIFTFDGSSPVRVLGAAPFSSCPLLCHCTCPCSCPSPWVS